MASFDVIPAIDLHGGLVVRLRQGDFTRATTYSDDPVAVARQYVDAGAKWLHVVDLDGARDGRPAHGDVLSRIVAAVGERAGVEVAGGLRTGTAVRDALGRGATRVVLGTAALASPRLARELVALHGADRLAVSIDVRDGLALGQGWVGGSPGVPMAEALDRLAVAGVRWFEVTAIDRDGTLGGPDLELLRAAIASAGDVRIIASGGIRSIDDLEATRDAGCAGAIIGRALHEGSLDLAAAVEAFAARAPPKG